MTSSTRIRVGLSRVLASAAVSAAAVSLAGDLRVEFDHLSLEDGLSQSIIEQMVQDRKGFMWFATENGLNRFDGYRFTVYKNVPGDPNSLSYNELKALYVDGDGVLWVGIFESGLNSLDPSTERIVRYQHVEGDPSSLGANTVRCILEDRAGRLWVGTQGAGLDRLDRSTGVFHHHRVDRDGHDDIRAIYEDRGGSLWIGSNGGGLDLLDPETGEFTHFEHDPQDPHSLSDNRVFAILEDGAGTLWVGTYGGGLESFDRSTGRFAHHRADPDDPTALGHDLVKALSEDHEGGLWIATDGGGLSRYDRDTGIFSSYRHNPTDPSSLAADRVFSVFEDRSRVLWVGTYGGGLSSLDLSRKRFRHDRHDPENPQSLNHDIVWSFFETADGVLWIGTDSGGLNRFDRESGEWRHYLHRPDDPSSLAHNTVRALLGDRNGMLWIATGGGGVDRFDPGTGRFTHFRHDPDDSNTLAFDDLRSVFQDSSGDLWFGTFGGGLDRYDPETGVFTHHRHDPEDPTSISHDFVRLVYEDSDGVLWVGTQGGGLNRFDRATGAFTHYRHDPDDPTSISTDHVFSILESWDGTMWLGTFGGGLIRFDRATGACRRYRAADGLAADSVYAMLEDENGMLWISTTKGLSRFDPLTQFFRNFDVRDGLQSDEFNGGSAYRSPSGEMFFGGINGFNSFIPDEITVNPVVPSVVITDFQLFNRSLSVGEEVDGRVPLTRPVTYSDQIDLSHRDNVFSLEFAALHFSAPGKNRYQYRMLGFSDDWVEVGADRRFATYTGLPAGEYVFSVLGSNRDGVWNEVPTSLGIVVAPPFWATWWFRLLAALILGGIALAIYRSRLRGVRMKTQLVAAHDAQMAIMPHASPELPGFDISGICIPAHEVGGDFFDYFWFEDEAGKLCVVVGDVAGKAMSAAMNAVMSDGMVFSRARQSGSVEEIMVSLNLTVHKKVGARMFTALCLLVVDPDDRTLTFANAGLCEPLLRSGESTEYLSSPGDRFPLGAIRDARYESRTVQLATGDVVVTFTDGVPEARDRAGEQYGYDAPRQLLARLDTRTMSAEEIRDALMADVHRCCGVHLSDDMAIVVIKACERGAGGTG
ncbi:MAG: SpoIIE family protein phosphatase [Thermoanaerobaculales bacterium]|jgi:ligand-binding sensor domain-containing protein/serine phosphatase RsbU (regulator of sigma subunit)|nr:SpoIIE family protein phosphatase [Thermoanaerobaculales bacterium]